MAVIYTLSEIDITFYARLHLRPNSVFIDVDLAIFVIQGLFQVDHYHFAHATVTSRALKILVILVFW